MSHDVQACNRRKGSGRVTPSKWRRTAVVAADGVLAVGAGAMAGLFGAGAASAAAPTPGWTGLQSPTPVGLNAPAANPGETFSTDACASAVSCVTAGGYFDGTTERGLLDALYRGSWSSVEAPLPPDANASPDVRFFDSTCAASDSCFAVGGYDNSMSGTHPEGLIESWAGGVWTATEAPLPADAAPAASADTWLKSVSCPAPGQCVAVGWYENDLSKVVGLIETLSNGTWTDMAAPQVADAATNQDVALTGLSCPAEGSCVADGIYTTSASGKGLEVLALSGGTWTASVAPLPMDAATGSNEYVGLNPLNELMGQNLSCAGSECEIGGFYHTMAGGTAPLLLRGTATTWTASSVGLPANAETGASESATLADTSCGFDGSCVAVGSYSDTSSRVRPLIASISTNGTATSQEAPEPSDAAPAASVTSSLSGVSCLSSTSCTAVGGYVNNTGSAHSVGMIDTLSGGTWSSIAAAVPSNAASGVSAESFLNVVDCSGRGACLAAGYYSDPGSLFGQLDTYTPPEGYWTDASDGGVFTYGSAVFHGSAGNLVLNKPVVGMAPTPGDGGYWLVASDGGIFSYGDAAFDGSAGSLHLNKPVVGMAAAPDGGGYWSVASDGGIFNYGSAGFYGSAGALHLNAPIVGMAATPDGHGYWLVASDGGIFTYGDAVFYGSTGGIRLNKPVVGMASSVTGNGYWLVASDGGIFSFGDALFRGSSGALVLNKPVIGMMPSFDGGGYWLVATDGGIFNYGDTGFYGSTGAIVLNKPMVGGAAS